MQSVIHKKSKLSIAAACFSIYAYQEMNKFEVKLRNELTQKAIAKECADWIRQKVTFKFFALYNRLPVLPPNAPENVGKDISK